MCRHLMAVGVLKVDLIGSKQFDRKSQCTTADFQKSLILQELSKDH